MSVFRYFSYLLCVCVFFSTYTFNVKICSEVLESIFNECILNLHFPIGAHARQRWSGAHNVLISELFQLTVLHRLHCNSERLVVQFNSAIHRHFHHNLDFPMHKEAAKRIFNNRKFEEIFTPERGRKFYIWNKEEEKLQSLTPMYRRRCRTTET